MMPAINLLKYIIGLGFVFLITFPSVQAQSLHSTQNIYLFNWIQQTGKPISSPLLPPKMQKLLFESFMLNPNEVTVYKAADNAQLQNWIDQAAFLIATSDFMLPICAIFNDSLFLHKQSGISLNTSKRIVESCKTEFSTNDELQNISCLYCAKSSLFAKKYFFILLPKESSIVESWTTYDNITYFFISQETTQHQWIRSFLHEFYLTVNFYLSSWSSSRIEKYLNKNQIKTDQLGVKDSFLVQTHFLVEEKILSYLQNITLESEKFTTLSYALTILRAERFAQSIIENSLLYSANLRIRNQKEQVLDIEGLKIPLKDNCNRELRSIIAFLQTYFNRLPWDLAPIEYKHKEVDEAFYSLMIQNNFDSKLESLPNLNLCNILAIPFLGNEIHSQGPRPRILPED